MDSFWQSATRWLGEKTSSPLYFTYIGFFVAWNWKFFYVLLFGSPTLFSSPRIEYIEVFKLPYDLNLFWDFMLNLFWVVGIPAIFTWVAILYLPSIHRWAFNIHIENYFDRKEVFDKRRIMYERKREQNLSSLADIKKSQAESRQTIEESTDEKEIWESEFEKFKKTPNFYRFGELLKRMYSHGGFLGGSQAQRDLGGIIGVAHANDLILLKDDGQAIELTEKGKFFAKRYLETNPL